MSGLQGSKSTFLPTSHLFNFRAFGWWLLLILGPGGFYLSKNVEKIAK